MSTDYMMTGGGPDDAVGSPTTTVVSASAKSMAGRIRPERVLLRLSDEERDVLKLLTAALKVSEYTDDVDGSRYQRDERTQAAMEDLFHTLAGLFIVGGDPTTAATQKEHLKTGRLTNAVLEPALQRAFEIGRRYKRMNPDKLRGEYGKLVMLLQDAARATMQRRLGSITLDRPMVTVGATLESIGASDLLRDDRFNAATRCIPADRVAEEAPAKSKTLQDLCENYSRGDEGKRALVERCIRSVDDMRAFIQQNLAVIYRVRDWLLEYFGRGAPDSKYSLQIRSGKGGACFSHSHADQVQYVQESLTLWGIIHRDIFDFWECAEADMLAHDSGYVYRDTGQGIHRVQNAPRTYARMHDALAEARREMGGRWVGSSVVHLGDNDVPNALVFIDKYTIIPRLLGPIVQVLDGIDDIFQATGSQSFPGVRNLLKSMYGDAESLRLMILCDFFKHAFDGSGDDGGSCIDGRLTSAWNWCHQLDKKPYHHAFVLTGFNGFDGNC